MRYVLPILLFLFLVLSEKGYCQSPIGQGYYTRKPGSREQLRTARKWAKSGEWRSGFTKAGPHKSVNLVDFYEQYHKSKPLFDAMFSWLEAHDLKTLPKGNYPIEGTELTVSVQDSRNEPLQKRKSESHYRHIDFQYVVRGTEGFALLDHTTSQAACPYKSDVIHYDYDPVRLRRMISDERSFFLFFPQDWHIAKVATEKGDQQIRVIVVKLPYVE